MKNRQDIKLREDWLQRATTMIVAKWQGTVTVPADVQVSCGFPGGGSPRRRIGECWPRSRSERKVNQIFISPLLGDPLVALDVLGHELLHAADDCKSGHGRDFTRNSKKVGYTGGKHSEATPATKEWLDSIIAEIGPYPHGAVKLSAKKSKTSAGLHKYLCTTCDDVLYTTEKNVTIFGAPCCRECRELMQPASRQVKKVVTTV